MPARMDEYLSAYLDGELSPEEEAWLEERLVTDPELQQQLESLRQTVALVRDLPQVEPPRNFLLSPSMVAPPREPRERPVRRWLAPALSFATAVSALLCAAVLGASLLTGGLAGDRLLQQEPLGVAMEEEAEATPEAVATAPAELGEAPEEEAVEAPAAIEASPTPSNLSPSAGAPTPLAETDRAEGEAAPTPTPAETGIWSGEPTPTPSLQPSPTATPISRVSEVRSFLTPRRILVGALALLTICLALASALAWRSRSQ